MKIFISLSITLFISISGFSQQATGILDLNKMRCIVTATGDLFFVPDGEHLCEVPNESGLHTMYAGNLWVGGIAPDQQLKLAAETYQADGVDWFTGPLTTDGNASTNAETQELWNHVWSANSADIETYQAYFQSFENGTVEEDFPNGYEIPTWILDWPAHGNAGKGQDMYFGPFNDLNADGFYDPQGGDFPVFCGEECLFFVFNDNGYVHSESQGQPIGLEIQCMMYAFNSSESAMLDNTVFLKYKIINRGTQTLTDTYIGIWLDFLMGNPIDNYCGTNVQRGTVYAMNGDEVDEGYYEDDLPMQGMTILAGPLMDPDGFDNSLPDNEYSAETNSYGEFGAGFGNSVIDDERFGLSYSMRIRSSNHPVYGDPTTPLHYYNFMNGVYKNSQIQVYATEDGPIHAKYIYPGNSDPLLLGTDGTDTPDFNDAAFNIPGERKMIASTGPITLMPGAIHTLDLAFVFARESDDDLPLAETFDSRLKEAHLFFDEYLVNCDGTEIPLQIESPELISMIDVYPNPVENVLNIRCNFPGSSIRLVDMTGRIILEEYINGSRSTSLNMKGLSQGCYIIHLMEDEVVLAASKVMNR